MESNLNNKNISLNNRLLDSSISKLESLISIIACFLVDLYNILLDFWAPIVLLCTIISLIVILRHTKPITGNIKPKKRAKLQYFDFSIFKKRSIAYPLIISFVSLFCHGIELSDDWYKQMKIDELSAQADASMMYNILYQENTQLTGSKSNVRDPNIYMKISDITVSETMKKSAKGVYLMENQQIKDGFRLLKEASKENNPSAKYYLANYMLSGTNGEQDEVQAFSYMLDAAKLELSAAQREVARMYVRGIGTITNIDEAKYWAIKSVSNLSNKYEPEAFDDIYRIYFLTEDYEQCYKLATKLVDEKISEIYHSGYLRSCLLVKKYKKAYNIAIDGVKLNKPDCYIILALMYKQGIYVKQDYSKAEQLLFEAVNKFNIGFIELAELYHELDMPEEQLFWENVVNFYNN